MVGGTATSDTSRLHAALLAVLTLVVSARFWWAAGLLCGATLAWSSRYAMNPDGLSYLDIASEAVTKGPAALLNDYWSPGYPALISLGLLIVRPSPEYEVPLLHLVNFLLFTVALRGFSALFGYWSELLRKDGGSESSDELEFLRPFGFGVFLWFVLDLIGLEFVTPDMGVAAIVLTVSAMVCRMFLEASNATYFAALGVVLGAGYYMKAALFPLACLLIVVLFLVPPRLTRESRKKLLLTAVVFLCTAAPLIVAMTSRTGRVSFGEVGRLNYVWYVNEHRWNAGNEQHVRYEVPNHPAPKLLTKPVTLEFASSRVPGTYPVWFDPSYWYAAYEPGFDVRQQIAALTETLRVYKEIAAQNVVILSGSLVLFAGVVMSGLLRTVPRALSWQIAWPLTVFAMYSLVHVEPRFLAAFLVLLWLGIYGWLILRANRAVAAAVCGVVLLSWMLPLGGRVGMTGVRSLRELSNPGRPEYQKIGDALGDLGVGSGDRIAVVGYGMNCYYARYARLRVVAQVPDSHEFWQLTEPELQNLARRLASIGVKAVVAFNGTNTSSNSNWKVARISDSTVLNVLVLKPGSL